jgi:hypothetical protein
MSHESPRYKDLLLPIQQNNPQRAIHTDHFAVTMREENVAHFFARPEIVGRPRQGLGGCRLPVGEGDQYRAPGKHVQVKTLQKGEPLLAERALRQSF